MGHTSGCYSNKMPFIGIFCGPLKRASLSAPRGDSWKASSAHVHDRDRPGHSDIVFQDNRALSGSRELWELHLNIWHLLYWKASHLFPFESQILVPLLRDLLTWTCGIYFLQHIPLPTQIQSVCGVIFSVLCIAVVHVSLWHTVHIRVATNV